MVIWQDIVWEWFAKLYRRFGTQTQPRVPTCHSQQLHGSQHVHEDVAKEGRPMRAGQAGTAPPRCCASRRPHKITEKHTQTNMVQSGQGHSATAAGVGGVGCDGLG